MYLTPKSLLSELGKLEKLIRPGDKQKFPDKVNIVVMAVRPEFHGDKRSVNNVETDETAAKMAQLKKEIENGRTKDFKGDLSCFEFYYPESTDILYVRPKTRLTVVQPA